MGSKLKATLWVLTLLTVGYASQQYRVAQQARASAQTQHTTFSAVPHPLFKVTQIGGQVMRVNETTGETYYWSTDGGGWVKVHETSLVTVASKEERQARVTAIRTWYEALEPGLKKVSYETFEAALTETPSWQIQQDFEDWKRKRTEEKERASLTALIQSWYKQLIPQEQAATPYEQYESTLLAATDLPARQGVIRTWYDLMDDTYKQKVPLKRFEAIEIQEPLINLQAALAKQREATSMSLPSRSRAGDTVFCPVGGERYGADVKVCPKHGVETQSPSSN